MNGPRAYVVAPIPPAVASLPAVETMIKAMWRAGYHVELHITRWSGETIGDEGEHATKALAGLLAPNCDK